MDDIQDGIIRTYARLTALKSNIEKINSPIDEKYVIEFHLILEKLAYLWGKDLSEFKVSDSYVKQHLRTVHMDGARTFSEKKYVDRAFLLSKMDAVLSYFELSNSKEPPHIGFRK